MHHEDKTKSAGKKEVELENGPDLYGGKNRSRVREVDFSHVENTPGCRALSPFELEVKRKLAQSPSAKDLTRAKEIEAGRIASMRSKLGLLLKQAHLSPRLQACYELLYRERLSDEEAATRLGLSAGTIRRHKRMLITTLHETFGRRKTMRKTRWVLMGKKMEREWHIWRLYHSKGLSIGEIQKRTGKGRSVLYEALRRVSREEIV